MKIGKLEKKVIKLISANFKVKPNEMLFVDDFQGNIEKAKLLGMQTILFTGIDNLNFKIYF